MGEFGLTDLAVCFRGAGGGGESGTIGDDAGFLAGEGVEAGLLFLRELGGAAIERQLQLGETFFFGGEVGSVGDDLGGGGLAFGECGLALARGGELFFEGGFVGGALLFEVLAGEREFFFGSGDVGLAFFRVGGETGEFGFFFLARGFAGADGGFVGGEIGALLFELLSSQRKFLLGGGEFGFLFGERFGAACVGGAGALELSETLTERLDLALGGFVGRDRFAWEGVETRCRRRDAVVVRFGEEAGDLEPAGGVDIGRLPVEVSFQQLDGALVESFEVDGRREDVVYAVSNRFDDPVELQRRAEEKERRRAGLAAEFFDEEKRVVGMRAGVVDDELKSLGVERFVDGVRGLEVAGVDATAGEHESAAVGAMGVGLYEQYFRRQLNGGGNEGIHGLAVPAESENRGTRGVAKTQRNWRKISSTTEAEPMR